MFVRPFKPFFKAFKKTENWTIKHYKKASEASYIHKTLPNHTKVFSVKIQISKLFSFQ